MNEAGSEVFENRAQNGSLTRPSRELSVAGPSSSSLAVGLVSLKRVVGHISQGPSEEDLLKGDVGGGAGLEVGPSCSKGKGWAAVEVNALNIGPSFLLKESHGPSQSQLTVSGLSLKACSSALTETCKGSNSELEFIMM